MNNNLNSVIRKYMRLMFIPTILTVVLLGVNVVTWVLLDRFVENLNKSAWWVLGAVVSIATIAIGIAFSENMWPEIRDAINQDERSKLDRVSESQRKKELQQKEVEELLRIEGL